MHSWELIFQETKIRPATRFDYRAAAFWTVTGVFFLALFTLAIIGLNSLMGAMQ